MRAQQRGYRAVGGMMQKEGSVIKYQYSVKLFIYDMGIKEAEPRPCQPRYAI